MPFKIVQTVEHGEVCLSIVPIGWEKKGMLSWPNIRSQVAKLCADENSAPTCKWEKIQCVCKREFVTCADAEKELKIMEEETDTDADQTIIVKPNKNKITRPQTKRPVVSDPNFNE